MTSNLQWAEAPRSVLLRSRVSGFPEDSAANVSFVVALDRSQRTEWMGKLPAVALASVVDGIEVVLGR